MILTPEVFGMKHLSGSLVTIVFIVLFLWLSLRPSVNRKVILRMSALLLIALELFKYTYTIATDGSIGAYMYPFNLCSFSLYVMPIVAFGKGKFARFMTPFTYAVGLLAGLLVLLYPSNVLGNSDQWFPVTEVLPFHSFIYHGNMIFFSIYLAMSKSYVPKFLDFTKALLVLLLSAAFANVLNFILDTDYMLLHYGNGSPFQFVIEDVSYVAYLGVMSLVGLVLIILLFLPTAFQSKKIKG
ncbi:YwaF family protein [Paracholeplasma manati]|uniref:YwaF family protein n=1 Tax=Paracholeplasma manati TaxID=591373 RepID=A0ABT2YBJ8_9MOLU|nr:YwaF family protein [Paracholeplasma manati]MCV2231693.1 YwaF family protein [Paracholeplasma manati]MDG0888564.1 YwaF family protein [Paracholeplasma manati]